MPTKSTRSLGASTARWPWLAAAGGSAGVGLCGADEVAARFLIRLELDQAALLGFLEEIGEGAEAVVGLVEARLSPLERLLDHRAPDALALAALGNERVERLQHELVGLLLLVLPRGRRLAALLRRAALLLVGAHQVVVIDELFALGDQVSGASGLYAEHELRLGGLVQP